MSGAARPRPRARDHAVSVGDGLLLVLAAMALALGRSDVALMYVRPTFRPYLLVAGIVLVVLGFDAVRLAWRRALAGTVVRDHSPAIVWMLLVPVVAMLLVPSAPLGTFAAQQGLSAVDRVETPVAVDPISNPFAATTTSAWPPLPSAVDGAVPLTLDEFTLRARYDTAQSLRNRPVRLIGFVSRVDRDGFRLTRFTIGCCAADARPVHVEVDHPGPAPSIDTWVGVQGRWRPEGPTDPDNPSTAPPVVVASSVDLVSTPEEPYEF